MKVLDIRPFINEIWKRYFITKNAYHCEIFNFGTQWKIGISNISQWKTCFLSKDNFHTTRMKVLDMRPFINEIWKPYFITKNAYHCEIFNFGTSWKMGISNISQWKTCFQLKDDFHTSRIKVLDMCSFIHEKWKLYFIRKNDIHYKIFNFYMSQKMGISNIS